MRQKLIYVFVYDFTLGIIYPVKENSDIKTAIILIFGPNNNAFAVNRAFFFVYLFFDREGKLHRDPGKRRYIFLYPAIRAYAADILGSG